MPKVSPIQNAFTSGELSGLLYGRTDFENYKSGLGLCLNLLPLIQGGVTRRPGTYICDEVKDSTRFTRSVRFKYSTLQAYILEFGHEYIRFKRNNAPVFLASQAISGITQTNPATVTYTGADIFVNGDHVEITGVSGMIEINGRRYKLTNVNSGLKTFQLQDVAGVAVSSASFGAYVSGGAVEKVYEIASPYTESQLPQLKFTQSADVLYIVHPAHPPRKLTRSGHTSWTLEVIDLLDGPYLPTNSTQTTMTPSANTGSITVTASSTDGINDGEGFKTTDDGRMIRIRQTGHDGYVRITSWISATQVVADVVKTLNNTTAAIVWRLGLYSETTGYPSATTFFEDRLMFGGSPANPARVDGSRNADYENFAPTDVPDGLVTDSHAVSYSLNSDDVQSILWMKGEEKALLIGTVDGEWAMRPSQQSEALSPTNVSAKQSTSRGSADIQAIRAGDAILFVQTAKRQLREMAYVFENDKFKTPDMTVLSEHITKGRTRATSGIRDIAYQKQPQSIVWVVRNDGVLLSFTYERDQKVMAWARHTIGGFSDAAKTLPAEVESVACIPSADGTRDEAWIVVKRFINGRVVRTNEFITQMWEKGDSQEEAVFADCAATYQGDPVTTVTGLWHLIGETVSVLADGAAHPTRVVSATGTITLDRPASIVQVGYAYNSDGQMLRLDAGAADGTAQGKTQRTHRAIVRLHDTLGLKTGSGFHTTGAGKLTEFNFRTAADAVGQAVPLYTGDVEITWEGTYTSDNYFCFRFDGLFPATILAVMPQLHTQDR